METSPNAELHTAAGRSGITLDFCDAQVNGDSLVLVHPVAVGGAPCIWDEAFAGCSAYGDLVDGVTRECELPLGVTSVPEILDACYMDLIYVNGSWYDAASSQDLPLPEATPVLFMARLLPRDGLVA